MRGRKVRKPTAEELAIAVHYLSDAADRYDSIVVVLEGISPNHPEAVGFREQSEALKVTSEWLSVEHFKQQKA